jgi:hypothetical protein
MGFAHHPPVVVVEVRGLLPHPNHTPGISVMPRQ